MCKDFVARGMAVEALEKAGQGGDASGTVSVQVSRTTTGAPGTEASVINEGDGQNVRLVFTIPQGLQGAKGDRGETGATGATGPKGDKGETGAQGPAGQNAPTIQACVLYTNAEGKVTGGQITLSEGGPITITVQQQE